MPIFVLVTVGLVIFFKSAALQSFLSKAVNNDLQLTNIKQHQELPPPTLIAKPAPWQAPSFRLFGPPVFAGDIDTGGAPSGGGSGSTGGGTSVGASSVTAGGVSSGGGISRPTIGRIQS